MPDPTTKPCSRCGETKPLEAFYPNRGGLFGRHSQCRTCHRELSRARRAVADPAIERKQRRARYERADKDAIRQYSREYRQANPERRRASDAQQRERSRVAIRARTNAWGAANPQIISEQNRKYRLAHLEQERARSRAYRAGHREEQRAKDRARRDAAPERHRAARKAWAAANPDKAYENRVRSRARKHDAYVAPVNRRAIYERDGGICGICRRPVAPDRFHLDHIIPLARGGTHEPSNVQVAHPRCNLRKYVSGPGQLRLLE